MKLGLRLKKKKMAAEMSYSNIDEKIKRLVK